MSQVLYTLFALAYIGLTAYSAWAWRRTGRAGTLMLALLSLGLIYDNGILAIGNLIGPGETLRALTVGRFCLHFVLTPLLTWTLLEQQRLAGQRWAASLPARLGALALMLGLMVYGFTSEVHTLKLELVVLDGVQRYINTHDNPASALVPILGALMALASGTMLWRTRSWPWLFLGTLAIFAAEGALRGSENLALLVVENAAEVIYVLGFIRTELFLTPEH